MKVASAVVLFLACSQSSSTATAFVTPSRPHNGHHQLPLPRRAAAPTRPAATLTQSYHKHSATQLSGSIDTQDLTTFFLEQVITSGVPALFSVLVIGFAASMFRSSQKRNQMDPQEGTVAELYNDLYGDGNDRNKPMFGNFINKGGRTNNNKARNTGVPSKQFLSIENRNQKLDSYKYSMTAATQSKALAASQARSQNFESALKLALGSGLADLTPSQKSELLEAEKVLLKEGIKWQTTVTNLQADLTRTAIDNEMKAIGVSPSQLDPQIETTSSDKKNETKMTMPSVFGKNDSNLFKELSIAQQSLLKLELNFVQDVVHVMGPDRANGIRAALLGDVSARGAGNLLMQVQNRPLTSLLQQGMDQKNLFVTRFPGDATASQVADLREEVTAIVRSAKPGDEALVVLQTGGGTVTGYGLAAAQLQRFKQKGMKLTIAVEQVAASGGYMMCCVADKIIASPFAVLGSIGVITDIPNAYDRLKQEGIEFQTVTAGKYKRTVTPTKKVTKEDLIKTKQDVEDILELFKAFVKENRPSLDIEDVATGETWFGKQALEKGLCDEIKTVDDVLVEYVDSGFNVFDIKYDPPPLVDSPLGQFLPVGQAADSIGSDNLLGKAIRWLVRTIALEVKSEIGARSTSRPIEKQYMAKDDAAGRYRVD